MTIPAQCLWSAAACDSGGTGRRQRYIHYSILSHRPTHNTPLYSTIGFVAVKQADRFYKHFGPGTHFESTRTQSGSPKQGCWTNHNLKIFLAKREDEGEEDHADTGSKDPDGLVKAIGVAAMYHGRPDMLEKVGECVRITQVGGCGKSSSVLNSALSSSLIR